MSPRRFLQRFLPQRHHVAVHRSLRFLGQRLHEPLWHLTRRSTAGATALGLFVACLPIPAQMGVAAMLAIALRVKLLVAVLDTWASNPLTMAPLLSLVFHSGHWLLGSPPDGATFDDVWIWFQFAAHSGWDWLLGHEPDATAGVAMSWSRVAATARAAWPPLLAGSIAVGAAFAVLGYFGVHGSWRLHLASRWRARRRARR